MKVFKKLVLALSFVACAVSANATTTTSLGTLPSNTPVVFSSVVQPAGPFIDMYSFTTTKKSDLSVSIINTKVPVLFDTMFMAGGLFSNPDGILFNSDDSLLDGEVNIGNKLDFSVKNANAGSYYFGLFGITTGMLGGIYSGAVVSSPVSPVPEASSAAMMLAGLFAMFLIAGRAVRSR